jgi:hypothetical protein
MAQVKLKYKQCKHCGKLFERKNPYNSSPYCSKECHDANRRNQARLYQQKRRELFGDNIGTNSYVDTDIITVNGQQRIKSSIILQKTSKSRRKKING